MAKRKELNTTVYVNNPDTGVQEKWGPGRKLSAADVKLLGWPPDHEGFRDANGDEDEPVSQEQSLREGHSLADGGPADNLSDPEAEAQSLRQAARELEAAAEGNVKRAGLATSQDQSHTVDEVAAQAKRSVKARQADAAQD